MTKKMVFTPLPVNGFLPAGADAMISPTMAIMTVTNIDTILARIDKLREAEGWTLKELSRRAGIGYDVLRGAKRRGHIPSVDVFAALAGVFGVSIDYIVFGTTNSAADLSQSETALLAQWRSLSDDQRTALIQLIGSMTSTSINQ